MAQPSLERLAPQGSPDRVVPAYELEGGSGNRCCHTEPASQIPPTHVHGDLVEAGSVLGDGSSEDPRCQ